MEIWADRAAVRDFTPEHLQRLARILSHYAEIGEVKNELLLA